MISKELSATLGFAVGEAKRRRHEHVCVEHVLYAILHDTTGVEIVEGCGGNVENLKNALVRFFDDRLQKVPRDSEYVLQQTIGFQRVIQRAVNHVRSAEKSEVEVGDILASIFLEKDSFAAYFLNGEGIKRLDVLRHISHGNSNNPPLLRDEPTIELNRKDTEEKKRKVNPLKVFTQDLVKLAAKGKLDPLIGRETELERTVQVLCRRRKNNPIFVGDPGVGKTAMAEGLAMMIHEQRVPDLLSDVEIFSLDMGSLLAGTKFRGDFELRLKGVISALKKRSKAVLFIDEIHTIVGAGATSGGSLDASNILKPVLASGEIRCIGSTTYEEYKNHFEKDRALSRRFEKIEISEPSVQDTYQILKGLKSAYEAFHQITFTNASLKAAAELSAKYINDRYLPDKAIDVIDEAGAYLRLHGGDFRKNVNPPDIEKIVSKIAKVPPQSVTSSDRMSLDTLPTRLMNVVFGQDEAIEALITAIKRSRAGLGNPEKPVGSFLFTGPTGVGKTEVSRQLAELMGIHFMRYDMSEYMEKHAVARLIGAPPGYIGFDQGGLLTDGIRKNPYCVLLLDEIEKAHQDLFNILLQVMDHATLTDNNGKKADFRNVILIMTSNAGSREMSSMSIGFKSGDDDAEFKGQQAIERLFSPEFRNRLDSTITFKPLTMSIMKRIVDKFMDELNHQVSSRKINIALSEKARRHLAEKGHDPRYGARPLSRLIQKKIKDVLSDEILFGRLMNGGSVHIDTNEDGFSFDFSE